MKEGTIPPGVMFVRMLQIGLIAFSIYSVSKFLSGTSQALDFALNRPVTEADQRQTLVQELPYFFLATDPNAVIREALDNEDYGLAGLYIDYASTLPFNLRGRISLDPMLVAEFEESQEWMNWGIRQASECFNGLVFRTADTASALGCQAGSNFFIIGDAADLAKEGVAWANGDDVDDVIVGLSLIGVGASFVPVLYPAAGGAGVAKSVIKAGAKTYPIAKPMRTAVRNAVDLPALKTELSTVQIPLLAPWRWGDVFKSIDHAKFLRPKHTDALTSGLENMVAVGRQAGPDVALRTFKKVDNFDDLATLAKVSKVAGDAAPNVLGIMGKNAPDFIKLAKPAVAYAKFTYKSSLALWGIAVALAVAALEYALRRSMWHQLKASGGQPSPFWDNNGMGIQGLKMVILSIVVLVGGHFMLHLNWENEKSAMETAEVEAAEGARLRVYLAHIHSDIQTNEQRDWYVESGMSNVCHAFLVENAEATKPNNPSPKGDKRIRTTDAVTSDFAACQRLVDKYLSQWPIKV